MYSMMNSKCAGREESGQVLIVMVFAVIALLAVIGLAIDGGMIILERRRMQNSGDAAALAGTRLLAQAICGEGADDAAIAAEVNRYAEDNGVPDTDGGAGNGVNGNVVAQYVDADLAVVGQVGGGTIPHGATGISVSVGITRATYFVSLVGVDTSAASAGALAMTGPIARLGGGVLPIAVPLEVVETLDPGEVFDVIETNENHGGMFCRQEDSTCIGDPSAANSHRGWLNLNYIYNTDYLARSAPFYRTFEENVPNRGCGPNPSISTDDGLQGWASGDCPYPFPIFAGAEGQTNGDFIHGDPGGRQSSLMEISSLIGQIVYVPVFDYIYMSDYMADHFPKPEDIGWPRAGGGGHAFLYHIVGFAAVRVQEIDGHTLTGEFLEAVIAEGQLVGSTGYGTGACNSLELYGVALWR
jgi:Flp pilus assembly protein TadG